MDDDLKTGCAFSTIIIVFFLVLIVLGIGGAVWTLFFNRHALPYVEETRRQTYNNSLSFQQGSQRDFENLCLQYQQATDDGTKAMLKDTIRRRKQDYTGAALDDNVLGCFSRLGIQ